MDELREKKILVVGAGGFVGGFLVEECLRRGARVWAGVRESTSRKWLTDERLEFVTFDFDDPSSLAVSLRDAMPQGKWDYIIYNLGATKCLRYTDFARINYEYLRDFTEALKATDLVPEKLLYISSLSVLGPGPGGYAPFTEQTIPQPNTRYGASKLKAEMWLAMSGLPYIIFRCTGIYGPRDHDYFLMFDSVRRGVDFSVGFRKQLLSFIYVEDLARAVCEALAKAPVGETYNISEEAVYTQAEFRAIASRVLGKRFVLPVKAPLWAVKCVCAVAEKIGAAKGKPSTLNRDKYNILRQRNWAVDSSKAARDFGFRASTSLEEGVGKACAWYAAQGWFDRKK
ncbi:MAG: NAD(P)-dependent oxidoreductase [Muribaculaceae bacterium]|nr:NAD(P)-dependent oxidoreductase [Muribaculaceae bacterium]